MHAVRQVSYRSVHRARDVDHGSPGSGEPGTLDGTNIQRGFEPLDIAHLDTCGLRCGTRSTDGARTKTYIPDSQWRDAGKYYPDFGELCMPAAVVLNRIGGRCVGGGGRNQLHVQVAVTNREPGHLCRDVRCVAGLKALPGDGHEAIETISVRCVQDVLNCSEGGLCRHSRRQVQRQRQCQGDAE